VRVAGGRACAVSCSWSHLVRAEAQRPSAEYCCRSAQHLLAARPAGRRATHVPRLMNAPIPCRTPHVPCSRLWPRTAEVTAPLFCRAARRHGGRMPPVQCQASTDIASVCAQDGLGRTAGAAAAAAGPQAPPAARRSRSAARSVQPPPAALRRRTLRRIWRSGRDTAQRRPLEAAGGHNGVCDLLRMLGLPLRGVWALTSSELPWAVPDGPT
jgi:hypothetical protein